MISIDITLLYQIIGFFVLLIILNIFLYRPVQRILAEREDKIGGSLKKAADAEKEAADGIASYEKRLKEAAVKGNEERNRIRLEGSEQEKAILEAARVEASKGLSSIKSEIASSRTSAMTGLKAEARNLAKEIAGKVLERNVAGLLVLGLLIPTIAFAAEGGHEGSGSTWKIINFVILAIGVYLVWTKVLSKLLDKRSADIKTAIDEAKRTRDDAEKKAAEYRQKLSMLEGRVSEIHNELRLEGEAEKARIIAEAGKAAEALKAQAKVAAEQEVRKAKLEIREEAARLAVELAEEILKKELSPADQERLVKAYLKDLRLN